MSSFLFNLAGSHYPFQQRKAACPDPGMLPKQRGPVLLRKSEEWLSHSLFLSRIDVKRPPSSPASSERPLSMLRILRPRASAPCIPTGAPLAFATATSSGSGGIAPNLDSFGLTNTPLVGRIRNPACRRRPSVLSTVVLSAIARNSAGVTPTSPSTTPTPV